MAVTCLIYYAINFAVAIIQIIPIIMKINKLNLNQTKIITLNIHLMNVIKIIRNHFHIVLIKMKVLM